jgi:hypothetical protein
MAKLTLAVAALVAVTLAGSGVQAQAEQFAAADQSAIVQDAQTQDAQSPTVDALVPQVADVQLADVPVVDVPVVDVPAPAAEEPVAANLAVATGPSMDAAALSPRVSHDAALSTHSMRRATRGSGVGLMLFGGAALITGLIIGDDAGTVIAVGGALVGLYGLYVFLGRPTGMEHGSAAHSQRIGLGYKLNTN